MLDVGHFQCVPHIIFPYNWAAGKKKELVSVQPVVREEGYREDQEREIDIILLPWIFIRNSVELHLHFLGLVVTYALFSPIPPPNTSIPSCCLLAPDLLSTRDPTLTALGRDIGNSQWFPLFPLFCPARVSLDLPFHVLPAQCHSTGTGHCTWHWPQATPNSLSVAVPEVKRWTLLEGSPASA